MTSLPLYFYRGGCASKYVESRFYWKSPSKSLTTTRIIRTNKFLYDVFCLWSAKGLHDQQTISECNYHFSPASHAFQDVSVKYLTDNIPKQKQKNSRLSYLTTEVTVLDNKSLYYTAVMKHQFARVAFGIFKQLSHVLVCITFSSSLTQLAGLPGGQITANKKFR